METMPAQNLTQSDIDKTIAAYEKAGGNATRAAALLGIPRSTMQSRLREIRTLGAKVKKPPTTDGVDHERLLRDLRKQLSDLQKKDLRAQSVVRHAMGLKPTTEDTPKFSIKVKAPKGQSPMIPIIFGSDYQFGEVIRSGEIEGINEYNASVAEHRLERMIEKAITITRHYLGQHHVFPAVIYVRAGDLFSGEIHEELEKTNDLHSIPAARKLVAIERRLIEALKAEYGKVWVVTVSGNHGRTTKKPEAKRGAETNFDTLSAWMLEMIFDGDPSVAFKTSLSGDALVNILGYNFLFTHGDRIGSRGGEGFIGPAGTVTRGFKKVHEYYAHIGVRLDYICVGHFHTSLKLEHGFVNGCLSGYSEYAKSGRYRPAPASQWLLLVTPDQGVAYPIELYLSERPRFDSAETVTVG